MSILLSLTLQPVKLRHARELVVLADTLRPHRLVKVLPDTERNPEDSSLVWIGYTSEELVIYARLYQRGTNASSLRRDAPTLMEGREDHLKVVLNTKGWGVVSPYYAVVVNPLGTVADRYGHAQWDGENYAESHIHRWGWEVLLRISFSTLDYSRRPWAINISRRIVAKAELQMLSPNLRGDPQLDAELILDWDYIKPRRPVSLVLIPSFRLQSEADTSWKGDLKKRVIRPMAGITVRAKRGESELLDATLFPDFSDVDVDIVEFQLNRLPVDYPEKRPFFTEGRTYAPESRLVRTRNFIQPLFGVKFYSSHERGDVYVNTLRDVYLGNVAFGKATWRAADVLSLSSSFVMTDSSGYQVFGGRGNYYFRPLNLRFSSSHYRNFPRGAARSSVSVERYLEKGLSFVLWYSRIGDGFLSPFNVRSINFDNNEARGFWIGYSDYARLLGNTTTYEAGLHYRHLRERSGVVLSENIGGYYHVFVVPWTFSGSFTLAYYGYLKYLYGYEEVYGIEDFTARYAEVSLPGYFRSEWRSVSLSVGFGYYLGHPMRSYTASLRLSPFGMNTGFLAYAYRTVLDDLILLQYYGELPLPFGVILKPYLNYTRDEKQGYRYLEGNLVFVWEPRPLTGMYLAINKRLAGEIPEKLHHIYEKEVFKVQVRWKVW